MQQAIRRDRSERAKRTKRWRDGIGRTAAPEQEDLPRRKVTRELERDHSTERRPADIERLADRELTGEPRRILGQRLAWIRRQDPSDRPNVPNGALCIEETFISTDP
jgi:hypothetical protein